MLESMRPLIASLSSLVRGYRHFVDQTWTLLIGYVLVLLVRDLQPYNMMPSSLSRFSVFVCCDWHAMARLFSVVNEISILKENVIFS